MALSGYVPVQCSACARHHLLLVDPKVVPICRDCGASAAVLPGAAYTADDVELFDRVEAAIRRDLASAGVARRLAAELRRAVASAEKPDSILLRLVDDLPTLRFLLPALSVKPTTREHRTVMARSIGMIATIVGARARQLDFSSLEQIA